MKIYIAGPMTGMPDLNFPAFHAAAKVLRAQGFTVVNPAELNLDPETPWTQCMRLDIRELVTCDTIFLLRNWTMSRGARLEFHIASQLCMQVIEAVNYPPLMTTWIGLDPAAPDHSNVHYRWRRDDHVHHGATGSTTGVPK